jgi:nucleoside phosphorylase
MSRKFSHNDYTVGWICAIPVELAAAKAVLDETHEELSMQPNDHNSYTLGRVGKHNVVITCLPNGEYGTTSATAVAMQLLSSFHSIRFGLMVGIGGGVPSSHADIRLGDIVVSMPIAGSAEGGVVQYDYGKAISGGHFQRTGMLSRPPQILLTSVSKLRGNHLLEESQVPQFLDEIIAKYPRNSFNFRRPKEEDRLFEATYDHVSLAETCQQCDTRRTVLRPERDDNIPVIHYGRIASGNQVVKDSMVRDRLSQELGVYCVEMEAAGLMNNFPCLVVRGICDYADSHKNKAWQGYAAAAAAAYTKELLLATSVADRKAARTVRQSLSDSGIFHINIPLFTLTNISHFF